MKKNKKTKLVVLASVSGGFVMILFAIAAQAESLSKDQRSRVDRILDRWKNVQHKELVLDSEKSGECIYQEDEDVVSVSAAAFEYSDSYLERCLATAMAQTKYERIEGEWLAHLGETESWIVRNGKSEKVAASDKQLEAPIARGLWASFASSELLKSGAKDDQVESETASRSIASDEPAVDTQTKARQLLDL